jgi:sulfite reductase alpha subunit-like flavoprotein
MGEGVHDALVEALGGAALQSLAAQGRYRRDVY